MLRRQRGSAVAIAVTLLAATMTAIIAAPSAAAAPAAASGKLDYDDQAPASVGDFDLDYDITVSETAPAAGDDVTVTVSWDETGADPWGYQDVAVCWDTPPGWGGPGGAPIAPDDAAATVEDTAVAGQILGEDVPGAPTATADFADPFAVNERVEITSYDEGDGVVHRLCARTDKIDERTEGLVDAVDDVSGSMTITLEAPQSAGAGIAGLLPTSASVGDGSFNGGTPLQRPGDPDGLPADPTWAPLEAPQSPGNVPQTAGGAMAPLRWSYTGGTADLDSSRSAPIQVTPSGSILTYSLNAGAANGTATVTPDGAWNYEPDEGFTGVDSFEVLVDDGDSTAVSTVDVTVRSAAPSFTVEKAAAQGTVVAGESIDYTITVVNTGAPTLTQVDVVDPDAPGCDRTGLTLPAGEQIEVTCSQPTSGDDVGTYVNIATVDTAETDSQLSNQVDVEVLEGASPRLDIDKSTSQISVEAGTPITYEIEVSNSGGVPLTGVTVTDPTAPACGRVIGSMPIGRTVRYDCDRQTAVGDVGVVDNTATVDSNETDAIDSPTVSVSVTPPDRTVSVPYECANPAGGDPIASVIPFTVTDDVDPVNPGDVVTWKFAVDAPGLNGLPVEVDLNWLRFTFARPGSVDDLDVALSNPQGSTANPASNLTTTTVNPSIVRIQLPNDGRLIHATTDGALTYPGANGPPVVVPSLTVSGRPNADAAGETLEWKAPPVVVNVDSFDVGNVPCNPTQPTTLVTTAVNPLQAAMDVDKSAAQSVVLPGADIDYTVVVENTGTVPLTGVDLQDAAAPDCAGPIADIEVGGSETVTCSQTMTESDLGVYRNTATVTSDQLPPVDSNQVGVVVTDEAIEALEVTLDAPSQVDIGQPIPVVVEVTNAGNSGLTQVSLVVAGASDCDRPSIGDLGGGASVQATCTLDSAALVDDFGKGAQVELTATADSDEVGPIVTDPRSVAVVLPSNGWPDVLPWYASSADWLDHWNLAEGYPDGSFRGGDDITRAQLARMVYRLAGSPDVSALPPSPFPDTPGWAADAVRWVGADPDEDGPRAALMTGTDGRFRPNDPIKRSEAIRLLYRFAGEVDVSSLPPSPFPDTPNWVADAVRWAAADLDDDGPLQPFIAGDNGRLEPNDPITRAQTSRLLYRVCLWLDTVPD